MSRNQKVRQPIVNLPAQHDRGHRAVAQRLVVKLTDIEVVAQLGFRLAPPHQPAMACRLRFLT